MKKFKISLNGIKNKNKPNTNLKNEFNLLKN